MLQGQVMPRCMFCCGWFLSETDELQGSSCECGENVCEDDQREAIEEAERTDAVRDEAKAS